ncbi:MAG: hypothetical protein CR997_08610 [Acidobacteria bacterium]|nr:MAG: hypothetical protein CR997_08610 [Acidobacteriota bacterium]
MALVPVALLFTLVHSFLFLWGSHHLLFVFQLAALFVFKTAGAMICRPYPAVNVVKRLFTFFGWYAILTGAALAANHFIPAMTLLWVPLLQILVYTGIVCTLWNDSLKDLFRLLPKSLYLLTAVGSICSLYLSSYLSHRATVALISETQFRLILFCIQLIPFIYHFTLLLYLRKISDAILLPKKRKRT